MTIITKCPTCKKSIIWNKKNTHRPFCSNRCQLIDFGSWLREEKRISNDKK